MFKQTSSLQVDTESQFEPLIPEKKIICEAEQQKCQQNQSQSNDGLMELDLLKEDSFYYDQINKQTSKSQRSNGQVLENLQICFKKFILKRANEIYNLFVPNNLIQPVFHTQLIDQFDQTQQVQELIPLVFANADNIVVQKLLLIIEQHQQVRSILQWIFDAVPILLCKDLIIATCKLILAYQTYKNFDPSLSFGHLYQNSLFMINIFNDPSLQFLKLESQQAESKSFIANRCFEILRFLSTYTQKFYEIFQAVEKKKEIKRFSKKSMKTYEARNRVQQHNKSKKIKKMKQGGQPYKTI